jgi:hypothetical protein
MTMIMLKEVIMTLYSIESSLRVNSIMKIGTPKRPMKNKYLVEKARNLK